MNGVFIRYIWNQCKRLCYHLKFYLQISDVSRSFISLSDFVEDVWGVSTPPYFTLETTLVEFKGYCSARLRKTLAISAYLKENPKKHVSMCFSSIHFFIHWDFFWYYDLLMKTMYFSMKACYIEHLILNRKRNESFFEKKHTTKWSFWVFRTPTPRYLPTNA